MHALKLLSTVLLGAVAASGAVVRQTPTFCTAINPPPTAEELKARHDAFAKAFIGTKNLKEAFSYISGKTYINHNPQAQNGAAFAYNLLSQFWPTITISAQRNTFKSPQSWLGYNIQSSGGGGNVTAVVDRFRWEAGCIVEHWDAGEVYPGN